MAMEMLFNSDVGLMSLLTIVAVIIMGGGFLRFFLKNMEHDERQAQAKKS